MKTYKDCLKESLIHKKINILSESQQKILSNPIDLNPQPCDNISPEKELTNKLDFIYKKLEDFLMGDNNDPLNKKFDINGILLSKDNID